MTDKQIIISGVDVSECIYYQYNMCTATKDNYGDCSFYCKDYDMNDCYYKQLKRKVQECEMWKNQVLTTDDEAIPVQVTQQQFEEYNKTKQALVEIKEIARWHTTSTDSEDIQDDMRQILQLINEVEL